MAKSSTQKLKLLRLYDILLDKTDEEHPMSVNDMIHALSLYGIEAERKSIYSDLEELQNYGLDLIRCGGKKNTRYYVGERKFELAELKLLVDAVESSKFISQSKSRALIRKLSMETSRYEAAKLNRHITVSNRKSINENVLYNIDAIHTALQNGKMISFQYMEWNTTKRLIVKKGGALYLMSPKTLIWDDENYYLVAWDDEAGMIKHFRVDKMKNIEVLAQDAVRPAIEIDPADYSSIMFGMYDGRITEVTLRCPAEKIGILIDRFGKEISIRSDGPLHCIVRVQVAVSPQFFGWLCGLGAQFQILSPEETKEQYRAHLRSVFEQL